MTNSIEATTFNRIDAILNVTRVGLRSRIDPLAPYWLDLSFSVHQVPRGPLVVTHFLPSYTYIR
jgi:hypothetical protein